MSSTTDRRLAGEWPTRCGAVLWMLGLLATVGVGCCPLQLPKIDPYGSRFFLPAPNRTELNWPDGRCLSGTNCFLRNRQTPTTAPPIVVPGTVPAFNPNPAIFPPNTSVGTGVMTPGIPLSPPTVQQPPATWMTNTPVQPLVQVPTLPASAVKPPPCEYEGLIGDCLELRKKSRALGVPAENPYKLLHRGKKGELLLTPSRIVAPVGSEVLVLAGICGADSHFVLNQPLELTLSQDSVGQIIDYQGRSKSLLTSWLPGQTQKNSGDYLEIQTSRRAETVKRGTPTMVDDIVVDKGQTWVSLSSASPGTSYLTAMAPKAEAWDKRLKSMEILWVDALWTLPSPASATAGAKFPLTTNIRQTQDGLGIGNWKVRYQIAGGTPASFQPSGSQTAEIITGPDGNASIEIAQPQDAIGPGTTFIRVDIIRPADNAAGYEIIESGVTSIRWVAPALTIRAIGPRTVAIATPFSYRLEITNPGDQVARDSTVTLEGLPEGLAFVSSNPKPTEYGNRLVWSLGDIPPGTNPNVIDIQFKSDAAVGMARLCFDLTSSVDQLQTQACAETQIVAPCLGVKIDGDRQARVGDLSTFTLTFVNQCDEPLRGLTAQVTLESAGLEIVGRSGPVTFGPMATALAFGESKSLDLTLRLRDQGTHCFRVDVQAEGGHTATIRRCITAANVTQPAISLRLATQGSAVIGEETRVVARVTNTGNVPLTGVLLRSENANSLQPTGASLQAYEENRLINIPLDRLEPGSSRDVTLGYQGIALDGNAFARFQVVCDQGVEDLKEVSIRITQSNVPGADPSNAAGNSLPPTGPAINVPGGNAAPGNAPGLLAVQLATNTPLARRQIPIDIDVIVTNQRSTNDQNVRVTLMTPPGLTFQGVVGGNIGVQSSPDGLQHDFTTFQELRSGETIRFTVRLLPVQTGTPRLEVTASSSTATVPSSDVLDLTISP